MLGISIWALDRWSVLPILPLGAVDVIPADAGIVLTIPELGRLIRPDANTPDNPWHRALVAVPGFQEDLRTINALIDTLFPSRVVLDRAPALLSLVPVGNNALKGTWIIDLRQLGKLQPETWLTAKQLDYQTSSFRGQTIWTIRLADGRQLTVGKIRNLLILAGLSYQVEAVLAVSSGQSSWVDALSANPGPDRLGSVFIHAQLGQAVLDNLLSPDGKKNAGDWSDWFRYVRLDIYAEKDGYRLEGQSSSDGQWLDSHRSPGPVEESIWSILPANTAAVKAINIDDQQSYFRGRSSGTVGRFQRFFLPWLEGPLLEITIRPFDAQLEDRKLYFFGFEDQDRVTEALNDWMEEVGVLTNLDYQGFRLTQVYENEQLFPFSNRNWSNPWWTVVGNYLLLAADRIALENWIDQYIVGNTIPLTEVARQITLSESGVPFSFFLDWKQWRTAWRYIIADQDLANALAGLGQLSLRVKTEGRSGSIRGLWLPQPGLEEEEDLSWRLTLSDRVANGPWLNRDETGHPLITVQDAAHQLYLVSATGKINWRLPLKQEILSDVRTIDLADRPALTFNTAEAVHLLDLEGNPIDPFPIRLGNPTVLPQTTIDFSDNRQYSFFVISTDGCVYGYDLSGASMPGWNPRCGFGDVGQPLLHFQNDNKDYLVVRNSGGQIQGFARDGSPRLIDSFPYGPAISPLQLQLLADKDQIVNCTDSGRIDLLTLSGRTEQFRLPVGENHEVKMVYENLGGDQQKDYLLASDMSLALHTATRRGTVRQFERTFPEKIDRIFYVPSFGKEQARIGLTLGNSNRIYLLSRTGEVEAGFPLAGSTPYFFTDLFRTGEPHLIVGYREELLAYRLLDLQ